MALEQVAAEHVSAVAVPVAQPAAEAVIPAAQPVTRAFEPPPVREAPVRLPDPPPTETPRYESRRAAPVAHAAAAKAGMPTWLLVPLFMLAFLGLGALLYFGYQRFGGGKAGFTGGEVPAAASPKVKTTNPLQKYVEVVGIRLTQDAKKKAQARFIAVNHGTAELNDLTANVTLWASTSRSEEDSVGTFTFKINSLGPNEAKEITTPLKTRLKVYELPDWQNMTAEVQLTSQ